MKRNYIGKSVIFRRMGTLDMGVINKTRGDKYGILSCTDQEQCSTTDDPLLLTRLDQFFDFMRGVEDPCSNMNHYIELMKYKRAYREMRKLVATINDTATNSSEQQYEEHDALRFIAKAIDDASQDIYVTEMEMPF